MAHHLRPARQQRGQPEVPDRQLNTSPGKIFGGVMHRSHALLIQNGGPTAGGLWQGDHGRELPSSGHRFSVLWQIMHLLRAPLRRGDGVRASDAAGIYPDPQRVFGTARGQIAGEHFLQAGLIDPPVFQCLIQTRLLALKLRRQRQFGERLCPIFAQQGVHEVKQRIFGSSETAIRILTKRFECVKI